MSELSHRQANELIQRARLSVQERDALATHLTRCETCRQYLTMHLHLSQNLQLEPVRTLPAPELRAALRRRVYNQQRRNQIMKPIRVFAGVAAVLVLIVAGWMLFNPDSPQVEPELNSEEATAVPTQKAIAAVETEMPTEVPTLPPTETAVLATEIPPTDTPLPTVSPTPERILITHPNDLIGTWHRNPPPAEITGLGYDLGEKVIRFYPGGTYVVADTVAEIEADNIQIEADYWFEDGLLWTQQPRIGQVYYSANGCLATSGRWGRSRFEVAMQDEQTLDVVMLRGCQSHRDWIIGTYTKITGDAIDLHIDPDNGLVINPDPFPDDDTFIVEGTLMEVDLTSSDAPQLLMRLPSGETVIIVSQPSGQILDTAGTAVDLTAYEFEVSPVNPLRIRATVQKQDNGLLASEDLIVLFVD